MNGRKAQQHELTTVTALVYADLSQLSNWDIIPGLTSRRSHLTAVTLQTALQKQVQSDQKELFFFLTELKYSGQIVTPGVASSELDGCKDPTVPPQRNAISSHLIW